MIVDGKRGLISCKGFPKSIFGATLDFGLTLTSINKGPFFL